MTLKQAKILIVDDEEMIRETLIDILEDENYLTETAENAEIANQHYENFKPDVILLDIWMPDVDGITLLKKWQENADNTTPVIMMSGHGTIETAVEATKLGAYDFLEKPLSTAKLLLTINRALETKNLLSENSELKEKINPKIEIIGHSQMMSDIREQAQHIAPQKFPILLMGNAGTGKQHLAHYIHQHSLNKSGDFVVANLSAIEREHTFHALVGSETRKGLLNYAENGTLYIDEVTNLSQKAQNCLKDVIEKQQYTPFGQAIPKEANMRIICASQFPIHYIKEHLEASFFDLITVAKITLPNLQEHSEDVPELLDFFSQYFADVEQMSYRHFSLAAQNYLRQYFWPGNIRELRNLVQRLLIQSEEAEISGEEAKETLAPMDAPVQDSLWSQIIPKDLSLREAREVFEYQYLLEQFKHCEGNIAKLSGRVGMDRTNLYRKLRSLGIDPTSKPN